jgi:ribosome-associated toxin RatA of RatAB toxin-antitoxin module
MNVTPPPAHAVTENRIRMNVPWRAAYDRAADVEGWPRILPHYRWVKTLETRDTGRVVEMAARRGFWPVRWTALLETRPEERRIYFTHLKGPARGMRVYWEFSDGDGFTDVTIFHELLLEVPLVRTRLGKWVVSEGFIRPIATKTLTWMKRCVEGARE